MKDAYKKSNITIACLIRNLLHRQLCIFQKFTGVGQANLLQHLYRCGPGMLLKNAAQIRMADMKMLCHILYRGSLDNAHAYRRKSAAHSEFPFPTGWKTA